MGIFDKITGAAGAQFLDVIQWMETDQNTLVYRFPVHNQAIQDGGKLVVREGQAAVFMNEGQLSQVFGPGTHELSTRTEAIASFFESIQYALNFPYKGDVFFVNTRQITAQKWGTPNPVMLRDAELGPVRLRAFGIYSYRVIAADKLLKELVGNNGLYTAAEINGQLKRKLLSAFVDTIGESKIPVLELAAQYMDLGDAMRGRMAGWFEENYGITLTDFVVENISLPPEVEKILDKRTGMGLVGDMGQYTQYQAANAIGDAAKGGPGGSNPMLDAGVGLAMGNLMGQAMGNAQAPQQPTPPPAPPAQAVPPPPPPQPQVAKLHYSGPDGQAELTLSEIADRIQANRAADHHIWAAGWPEWKSWKDVPEVAGKVPPPPPPQQS